MGNRRSSSSSFVTTSADRHVCAGPRRRRLPSQPNVLAQQYPIAHFAEAWLEHGAANIGARHPAEPESRANPCDSIGKLAHLVHPTSG
jgi:hypothetical protein